MTDIAAGTVPSSKLRDQLALAIPRATAWMTQCFAIGKCSSQTPMVKLAFRLSQLKPSSMRIR